MNEEPLLIGIDIGTTGCKTVAVDTEGEVVTKAYEEYPLYTPRHGWSEQNPEDWWNAAYKTLQDIVDSDPTVASRIVGIGLSGQMHGLVPLDKHREVIRNCILWNDQRNELECREVHERVEGLEELLRITNNPMLPGYTGGKFLWMRKNEPEL